MVADNSNSAKSVMKEYKKAYINESNLEKVINLILLYNLKNIILIKYINLKLEGKIQEAINEVRKKIKTAPL